MKRAIELAVAEVRGMMTAHWFVFGERCWPKYDSYDLQVVADSDEVIWMESVTANDYSAYLTRLWAGLA